MPPGLTRSIILRLMCIAAGTIAAGGAYFVLHEYCGGPFMFVTVDPPAADPQRNLHVAQSWIAIYAGVGFAGGAIGAIGCRKVWHATISLIPAVVIVLLRTKEGFRVAFLSSEEGRYGIPSALALALVGGLIAFAVTKRRRSKCEQGQFT